MAGICRLGAKLKSADCLLFSLVLALVKMPNSAPMMRVEIVFSWANTFDEEKKIREKQNARKSVKFALFRAFKVLANIVKP